MSEVSNSAPPPASEENTTSQPSHEQENSAPPAVENGASPPSTSQLHANAPPFQAQQQFNMDTFPSNSDVLRLRGLPYTATEEDVRTFFEGYELDPENPIVIISQGYHRGEGFVKFKSVEHCGEAFRERNRQCIGPRYIELYPSTESAMNLAAQQLQAMGNQKNHIIRLRGLPFQATDINIYEFFSDITASIANVQICSTFDGRSTGDAFVELTTEEALRAALEKNRSMLGPRYIEVFVSNAHERDVLVTTARRGGRGRGRGGAAQNGVAGGRGRGTGQMPPVGPYQTAPRQPSSYVVRVRGLPYTVNEAQVAEFFNDVQIAAQGVHLVYNAQEKPTGEAFVEVVSERDVHAALQHNGAALGHRYIEVFRSSGADMGRLAGAEEPFPQPVVPQPMNMFQPQYIATPPFGYPSPFAYQPPAPMMFPPQPVAMAPPMAGVRPQPHAYSWSNDLPANFAGGSGMFPQQQLPRHGH